MNDDKEGNLTQTNQDGLNEQSVRMHFILICHILLHLMTGKPSILTLSSLQTDSDITANNANPDETNHLLRIYTACRSVIDFGLKSFFAIMNVSIFRNYISFHKARGKWVKKNGGVLV